MDVIRVARVELLAREAKGECSRGSVYSELLGKLGSVFRVPATYPKTGTGAT